jgi:hypothetical protein
MKDPKVWWAVLKWLASLVAGAALNEAAGMVVKGPCKRWLDAEKEAIASIRTSPEDIEARSEEALDIFRCCNSNYEAYKTNYRYERSTGKCVPLSSNS